MVEIHSYVFYFSILIIYIISGSVLSIILSYLIINRKILKAGISVIVLIFALVWLTANLLEYLLHDIRQKELANYMQYLGIFPLPAVWAGFCYQYLTENRKRAVQLVLAFLVVPAAGIVCLALNPAFGLLWINPVLHENGIKIVKEFQPAYHFFIAYSYLLFVTGFILIFAIVRRKRMYLKRQFILLVIAGIIPFLSNIFESVFEKTFQYMELTPALFSLSCFIVIYFTRMQYFRTIPLAQHIIIESMTDLLILLNPENRIIFMNMKAVRIFNIDESDIIGKPLSVLSDHLAGIAERIQPDKTGNEEFPFLRTVYNVSVSPVSDRRQKIISRVLVLRDITNLKNIQEDLRVLTEHLDARVKERTKELDDANRALKGEIAERKIVELKLNDSLKDKTILLGEIHHRVKNNLQIIISLLKLQKKYITEDKSIEIFNTAISRIQSIAIIHEKLYKSKDSVNTDLSEYIRELAHYVLSSHIESSGPIKLVLDIEHILLDIDRSIHCGLVINELIINAIKYAFPRTVPAHGQADDADNNRKVPEIYVSFKTEDEDYILMVKDNGVGFPEGFNAAKTDSLGMQIVTTLTHQLGGVLSLTNDSGAKAILRFPAEI